LREQKPQSDEAGTPPVTREQFALSSLGLVVALFLFLGAGNLTGVKATSLVLSGTKALSWYYYDKKLDLVFAIAYLLAVAGWQTVAP